jgi:hypothetical protein
VHTLQALFEVTPYSPGIRCMVSRGPAVPIIGVVTAIAVAGSPRHHLHHGRAFPGEQKTVLIFQALEAARRDVVLDVRRGRVRLWLSRKTFSHLVVFSGPLSTVQMGNLSRKNANGRLPLLC